jgi:succinate dehydrogenase/fumarate reductase cytochrome b subunit
MKLLHYFSGLTISVFIGFHLLNHLLILRSEDHHIRFMQSLRKIYRIRVIEIFLFLGISIQLISGVTLVILKWNKIENYFDVIQIASGLYLALFLTIHLNAVMVGRYKLKVDTNLYYGAGVMNMWPHKLFFIPYYSLSILSFFFHVACIHRVKMSKFLSIDEATTQSFVIMGIGIIVTALIIFKMSHLKFSNTKIAKIGNS